MPPKYKAETPQLGPTCVVNVGLTTTNPGDLLSFWQQPIHICSQHVSIILVNDQLDAQFCYFIIRLLQSSTCFEQRRAHHQEVKLY